MNKTLFFFVALLSASFLLTSCTAQQGAVDGAPSAASWRKGVKGQWVLYSIDKENVPTAYSVKTIFEEAPAECFVGSVWNLPNNGKGSITFAIGRAHVCTPVTNAHL